MSPGPRSRTLERGPGDCVTSVTTLPSGLRVVTEAVPGSRSASIGVWVAVGSVDESPRLGGASHYLEHLLFKGTRRRDASTIAGLIDMVGGELNAFTAHEYTCYYAHVLADDAARAIDVVCDVVLHARIASKDVETERSVILDEIAMRDDDPADALAEAFAARLFAGHAVGEPVSGTARSVRGLTRTQIHGYYRRRYDPSRMVVAVAGGVAHREVVRWVREAFAEHQSVARTPAPPRTGPGLVPAKPSVGLLPRDTEQAQLTVGAPALPRHHPDRFALAVLSTALGGGMSSRLFQRIREERGLAYTCFSSTSAYADTGSWSVYTACQPANLAAVADLVAGELAAVATDGISADELNLAQGQLCGATVLGLEDTESRMNRIGRRALTSRRYVPLDDELAAIRGVTGDQVTALARRLLSAPLTVEICGPFERLRDLPDSVRTLARRPQWGG
jgi:predicted Zn-dependent peptidase